MDIRLLKASEIEVRVGSVSQKGATLLLYKDARCDMAILDETFGSMNWQRHHSRDNANCTVSIWDSEKNQWVEKEDTGTESFTEKEKGLASDSFKRACFNVGIGRELYTGPRIFIHCATQKRQNGKGYELVNPFEFYGVEVAEIGYKDRVISKLVITKDGNTIYTYPEANGRGRKTSAPKEQPKEAPTEDKMVKAAEIEKLAEAKGQKITDICKMGGVVELMDMNIPTMNNCIEWLNGLEDKNE